jgi:hypothetical protein
VFNDRVSLFLAILTIVERVSPFLLMPAASIAFYIGRIWKGNFPEASPFLSVDPDPASPFLWGAARVASIFVAVPAAGSIATLADACRHPSQISASMANINIFSDTDHK